MTFMDDLTALRERGLSSLAGAGDLTALGDWERATIGPKGELTGMLRQLGKLTGEERPEAGRAANAVKVALTAAFAERQRVMATAALADRLVADAVDVTLPGRVPALGGLHPVAEMIEELSDIFALMGFQTVFGPEVELAYYNFDQMNVPKDHPARDMWDTIAVEGDGDVILRTHTSPMQARVMERQQPPVRVIVPGRCYRFEALDASHEWAFHQLEGLAVDEHITMADLKGVLREMAVQLFGGDRRIRFRCDFFPFVEPGVDFSVDCAVCDGRGCRTCKHTGWLEMGGAGMVHPNVMRAVGYDPERYTGFAFGLGIERMVMMRHGVSDVRAFAGNDLRFLRQFVTGV